MIMPVYNRSLFFRVCNFVAAPYIAIHEPTYASLYLEPVICLNVVLIVQYGPASTIA